MKSFRQVDLKAMNKKTALTENFVREELSRDIDRPASEMRVDLHIYIVPPELWREHLQSAMNQVINDTVSAGFIRVFPEATVSSLREEIGIQIGFEIIPREFVFLKCVGRCLTRIKPKQESLLKVKNFIPPQAYAPEMFILEATSDIQAIPYSGSTSVQSLRSVGNELHSATGSFSDHNHVPAIKSKTVGIQTADNDYFPNKSFSNYMDAESYEQNDRSSRVSPNDRDPRTKSTQTYLASHQSGMKHSQKTDRQKKQNELSRDNSSEEDSYYHPLSATSTHLPVAARHAKGIQTLNEEEAQRMEELMRKQIEEEKRKVEEGKQAEKERLMKKKKEEEKQKQLEEEEKKRQREEKKRLEEEAKRRMERKRMEEEKNQREEAEREKKEEEEERRKKEEQKQLEEEEKRRQKEEKKRLEEETKRKLEQKRMEEEKRKQREEAERKKKEETEKLKKETERKEREELRRKEEEHKRLEHQKKLEEEAQKAKIQQQKMAAEKAGMINEIEELRTVRVTMEQKRDELMKKTKQLQARTPAVNKHNVRDNWKKKYFEEKKKTAPLDEHCNRLKQHLESIHKRILVNMESVPSSIRSENLEKGAKSNNLQFRAKQLEQNIEEIQHRLENVKMKLTGEMKLRNQAEKDMRVLRATLTQRKLHQNQPDSHRLTSRTQPVTVPKA